MVEINAQFPAFFSMYATFNVTVRNFLFINILKAIFHSHGFHQKMQ